MFVAPSGTVYIVDSGNHKVRAVENGNITTIAGTGVGGFAGDDSLAVKAELNGPTGVFSDSTSGRLYIADTFNQRIRRVNVSGTITTVAGDGLFDSDGDDGPANHASFRSPVDVWVDSLGQIVIADRDNHLIRRVVPDNVALHGGIGAPERETQLFSVGFTGDGSTSVDALTLTLFGTPGILDVVTDFSEFRLYESLDATLYTSGTPDLQVGAIESAAVNLGVPFTIALDPPRTPAFGVERHYLVSALVGTTATEHDSAWVEFATGGLSSSTGGRGMVKANPDTADVLEIDVIATKLAFSTQPAASISGIALGVTPIVEAWDNLGFLDTDFSDVVTLTTDAPGTLQFSTAIAANGVATYPNLANVATEDEEAFTLLADDETGGVEGDLAVIESNQVTSSSVNDPPVVTIPAFTMQEDETEIRPLSDFDFDDFFLFSDAFGTTTGQ